MIIIIIIIRTDDVALSGLYPTIFIILPHKSLLCFLFLPPLNWSASARMPCNAVKCIISPLFPQIKSVQRCIESDD